MSKHTVAAPVAQTFIISDRITGRQLQTEYGTREGAQKDCDLVNRWEDRPLPSGELRYFVTTK